MSESDNQTSKSIKSEVKVNEEEEELAPIFKLEFMIYLIYWCTILAMGCYTVHTVAYRPATLKYWRSENMIRKSYFGLWQSEVEYLWIETVSIVNKGSRYFALYILVSRFIRSRLSPNMFMLCCTLLTLLLNYYHSSMKFLLFEAAILLIPSLSGCLRSKTLVWISSLVILYATENYKEFIYNTNTHLFGCAYGYVALLVTRAIAAGLTIVDSPKLSKTLFLEINFYYWYFPALIGWRMMTVKDFIAQVYQPFVIQNWEQWFCLAIRVILWYCLWTIVSALFPFFLVITTHDINSISYYVISGGQLFFGIHFFMVNFINYNMVYLVTQLDGFLTAKGPICICHVALYSEMWKSFDVAMHLWIKEYIFRPIVRCGDFKKTRIIAIIASFSFVVAFHGPRFEIVFWICLNVVLFILHRYLSWAFQHSHWGRTLQKTFSPSWNRRLIAVAGGISWFISIYGFGVFCYGFKNNTLIYKNLTRNLYRIAVAVTYSYCHSQLAMTVNAYLAKRKAKNQ